jgi:hypothetical protein
MEWTQVFSENENLDSIICVIELKGILFPVYYVNGMLITFTYYEITTSIIRSHTYPSRSPELTTNINVYWAMLAGSVLTIPGLPGLVLTIFWAKTSWIAVILGKTLLVSSYLR